MFALGIGLGFGTVFFPTQIMSVFTLVFFAGSVGYGEAVVLGTMVIYRKSFPDGIPKSETSEIISPGYYGKVAGRHFVIFLKAFLVSVLCSGLIILVARIK